MKSEIQVEPAEPQSAPFRFGLHTLDFPAGSGDGYRVSGIDCSELGCAADIGQKIARHVRSQRQCGHPPLTLGLLLVAATRNHDAGGLCERKSAGRPSRGNLANTMSKM